MLERVDFSSGGLQTNVDDIYIHSRFFRLYVDPRFLLQLPPDRSNTISTSSFTTININTSTIISTWLSSHIVIINSETCITELEFSNMGLGGGGGGGGNCNPFNPTPRSAYASKLCSCPSVLKLFSFLLGHHCHPPYSTLSHPKLGPSCVAIAAAPPPPPPTLATNFSPVQ